MDGNQLKSLFLGYKEQYFKIRPLMDGNLAYLEKAIDSYDNLKSDH